MTFLRSVLLCDYAQVRANLLTVVSGGITRFGVQAVPQPVPLWLALMVEVRPEEVERTHELRVRVQHNDTLETVMQGVIGFQANSDDRQPGDTMPVAVTVPIFFEAKHLGAYDISVSIDSEAVPNLTFWVVQKPGGLDQPSEPPAPDGNP